MIADLDLRESKALEKAISNSGRKVESGVNDFIHSKGAKMIVQAIIHFIPKSYRDKNNHAKDSDSLNRIIRYNLGVEVKSTKRFNYLVFPDEGIGRHNRIAQQFSTKGLKSVEVDLMNQIIKVINEGTELE